MCFPLSLQVNRSLDTERAFAQKLGQQAARTQVDLTAALQASAELSARNTTLDEELQARRACCARCACCAWRACASMCCPASTARPATRRVAGLHAPCDLWPALWDRLLTASPLPPHASPPLMRLVQDEQEHVAELAAAAATLEQQLASANDQAAKQGEAFERLGRESLSLKEALTQMKTRSAEMAVSAQVGLA